eukprot:RCo030950
MDAWFASGTTAGPFQSSSSSAVVDPVASELIWSIPRVYCGTLELGERAVAEHILLPNVPLLGMDCEWRPNFRKGERPNPVALVQLYTGTVTLLLHVRHFRDLHMAHVAPNLKRVLQDPAFVKVGHDFRIDADKLVTGYGITLSGTRDTFTLAGFLKRENLLELEHLGICDVAQAVLQVRIPKKKSVALSNWEIRPLSEAQQRYAAADAILALEVYKALLQRYPEPVQRCITQATQLPDRVRVAVSIEKLAWAVLKPVYPSLMGVVLVGNSALELRFPTSAQATAAVGPVVLHEVRATLEPDRDEEGSPSQGVRTFMNFSAMGAAVIRNALEAQGVVGVSRVSLEGKKRRVTVRFDSPEAARLFQERHTLHLCGMDCSLFF